MNKTSAISLKEIYNICKSKIEMQGIWKRVYFAICNLKYLVSTTC